MAMSAQTLLSREPESSVMLHAGHAHALQFAPVNGAAWLTVMPLSMIQVNVAREDVLVTQEATRLCRALTAPWHWSSEDAR
jgi:hypothetical protein